MGLVLASWAVLGTVPTAFAAEAAGVRFTRKPSVSREGGPSTSGKFRIEFAVSAPTDVAVRIIRKGSVVRHLAAGVLGKSAPKPLVPGLSQSFVWDGKDDAGRAVDVAGCAVHVGLGLKPTFDRILGWRGEAVGGVFGLTVDDRGRVYVLSTEYKKPTSVHVLTREGKYVRTVMPYPANLPHEKVKALGHIEIAAGARVPIIRDPISFTFYPEAYPTFAQTAYPYQTIALVGNKLVLSNAGALKSGGKKDSRRLLVINRDGSLPENYLGPVLTGKRTPGYTHLAPAPDGRHVFVSGLRATAGKNGASQHVVYRVALDEKGPAKVYLGELNRAGPDEKHFNDPRGIAVDKHGNLYVADSGNNRIMVFDPKGRPLGRVPVEAPDQLAVHQRSCAIYARCGRRGVHKVPKLTKLSPAVDTAGKWKGGSKVLGSTRWEGGYLWGALAVDGTSEPTVIWTGGRADWKCRFLRRIEERDGVFSKAKPIVPVGEPALSYGGFVAVDREKEEVYVHNMGGPGWSALGWSNASGWIRIDGRTGKMQLSRVKGMEIAVGPAGHLYAHQEGQLARFDREGKPVAFAGTGSHVLVKGTYRKAGGRLAWLNGLGGHCVGANGNIYVMYPEPTGGYRTGRAIVDVYGPDGKLKKGGLIVAGGTDECVRVDYQGNAYLCSNVKTKTAVYPPELLENIPRDGKWQGGPNWYAWYGSVLKFGPRGGALWGTKGKDYTTLWGSKDVKVEGALWAHTGIFPVPDNLRRLGCSCFGPRFDVDGFGRVFMPDAATFSVRVIDTSGNPIARFGSYGNMDSQGPGSKIPVPEIPFAWPQYVAVSNEAVYVSDVINRRVVRVRLGYVSEESRPIR